MRLATPAQIRELEAATIKSGVDEKTLMERAGLAMAQEIERSLPTGDERVLILAGPGHNGGDAFVVTRELKKLKPNLMLDVRSLDGRVESTLRRQMREQLTAAGVSVGPLGEPARDFSGGLVVDGLFGVGFDRELSDDLADWMRRLNDRHLDVIALDLPSGLDAMTGRSRPVALTAAQTLTVGLAKPGFFLNDGPATTGRVRRLEIGFDRELVRRIADDVFAIGAKTAAKLLPRREANGNKSHFGRVLVIGGSVGMEGAAVLTATAAARCGAGYVTLCTPGVIPFDRKPADFLHLPWEDLAGVDFTRFDAIAIGPGWAAKDADAILIDRLKESAKAVVLDAGAFDLCARRELWPLPHTWIVTPHAGELSRAVGRTSADLEADRVSAAREGSQKIGAHVLFKGFHTVVDDGRRSFIVDAGNVALAKAGTGDVLTGVIAALRAQGLGAAGAAVLGAYLHGAAADLWVRKGRGQASLMASDLPEWIGKVTDRLTHRSNLTSMDLSPR